MRGNLFLCLGLVCWFSTGLPAQQPESAGVSGRGSAMLERPASRMRVMILLTENGPTAKEALAKLSERRQAATLQLQTLGADKASVKFGKAEFTAENNEQRRQMEEMIQERIARGARVPKGLEIAKSVSVQCTLSAEWPLAAANEEELLVQTKSLEEKITAADLAGLKEPKKLSPQEAELQEELASNLADTYYDESQPRPGQPQFLYVARISEAELDKALEEAFGKARTQADRLARAAGAELGELATLRRAEPGFDPYQEYGYFGSAYQSTPVPVSQDEMVSQSPTPGSVKFHFHVEARFRLSKDK